MCIKELYTIQKHFLACNWTLKTECVNMGSCDYRAGTAQHELVLAHTPNDKANSPVKIHPKMKVVYQGSGTGRVTGHK